MGGLELVGSELVHVDIAFRRSDYPYWLTYVVASVSLVHDARNDCLSESQAGTSPYP